MGELWDVYTKDRRLTGKTCIRGEQGNLLEDEFHMWVMVWIKNPKTGKYLVSQRSADKDTDPLKWETVAGHAVSGDTSLDAAQREVFEEVGITLKPENAKIPIFFKFVALISPFSFFNASAIISFCAVFLIKSKRKSFNSCRVL